MAGPAEMRAQHAHVHARSKMGAGQRAQHRAVTLYVAECNLAFKLSDQISVYSGQPKLALVGQIISLIFYSEVHESHLLHYAWLKCKTLLGHLI